MLIRLLILIYPICSDLIFLFFIWYTWICNHPNWWCKFIYPFWLLFSLTFSSSFVIIWFSNIFYNLLIISSLLFFEVFGLFIFSIRLKIALRLRILLKILSLRLTNLDNSNSFSALNLFLVFLIVKTVYFKTLKYFKSAKWCPWLSFFLIIFEHFLNQVFKGKTKAKPIQINLFWVNSFGWFRVYKLISFIKWFFSRQ
jgi:hypothetical protein